MLISYNRPEDIAWTLLGTGAAFLTSSDRLNNGRPTSATRIQWLSGAQTTASVLTVRAVWSSGNINIRFVGIVGTTLPVGTKVVCRRRFDLSWNDPQEQHIIERADGVRVVWFYFEEDGNQRDGFEFQIFNDVGGAALIPADSDFEIGEAWGGEAGEWCIKTSYSSDIIDHSKQKTSIAGQPFPIRRRVSKTSSLEFSPVSYDRAFTDDSFAELRRRLVSYQNCVVVPIDKRPFVGENTIDPEFVNRHSEFGYASSVGPITGEAPKFIFSAMFQSPPVLLP